jgi:hypothetical protein
MGDMVPTCSTRLSCHMLVMRELPAAQAFGSLQGLMEVLTEEWEKCLHTDQQVSSKLPPSVRNPNPDVSLEPVPYFEMLWATEAELQEARREMAVAEERTMVAKSTCAAAVLSSRERALKSPTSWFWASDEKDLKRALKPNASWPRMLFWSASWSRRAPRWTT